MPLDRVGPLEVPPESGDSFQENARRKAVAVASAPGPLDIADDSGLEVDALGGQPGVFSARFGVREASDADRIALLLRELQRTSRGAADGAVSLCGGRCRARRTVQLAEGVCEGRIAHGAAGSKGSGTIRSSRSRRLGLRLAEVEPEVKNRLSHRAQAIAQGAGDSGADPCQCADGSETAGRCGPADVDGRIAPESGQTGRSVIGAWRSPVAHLLWEQGVGGSNPLAPTSFWITGSASFECQILRSRSRGGICACSSARIEQRPPEPCVGCSNHPRRASDNDCRLRLRVPIERAATRADRQS